jgi:CheY-like chemotaxis protein
MTGDTYPMELASVLLVDDDLFTRTALSAALSSRGIKVVVSTDNAAEALENLKHFEPDVAIVDLDLGPGPSGIDICHALRSQKSNLGLILLTTPIRAYMIPLTRNFQRAVGSSQKVNYLILKF